MMHIDSESSMLIARKTPFSGWVTHTPKAPGQPYSGLLNTITA